jgi:hypothetical protein
MGMWENLIYQCGHQQFELFHLGHLGTGQRQLIEKPMPVGPILRQHLAEVFPTRRSLKKMSQNCEEIHLMFIALTCCYEHGGFYQAPTFMNI